MQFVDLSRGQVAQQGSQIHLGAGARRWRAGQVHHRGAAVFKRRLPVRVRVGGIDEHGALGRKQWRVRWGLQIAVHHHKRGLARRVQATHIKPGLVLQHGANAGEQRAGARAPGMAVGAGGLAGNPLALAIGQGGDAVQRGGGF